MNGLPVTLISITSRNDSGVISSRVWGAEFPRVGDDDVKPSQRGDAVVDSLVE
jgi:hypothetical protein